MKTLIRNYFSNAGNVRDFYDGELSVQWNTSGRGSAKCPFHDDKKPSFSIDPNNGAFKCFGCNAKGSIIDFYMKRHGVDYRLAVQTLLRQAGLEVSTNSKIVASYGYTDENGKLLFQVVRFEPKDFRQRRPDGNNKWIWNLYGVRLIPYNLPEVLKSERVIIVEGEKDVESLGKIGLVASCNAQGAGKWKPEYSEYFKGKEVTILPDNDGPGRMHAKQVANSLISVGISVKIVDLPGLPVKGDVSDWIEAGGTKEALLKIISNAAVWEPETEEIKPDLLSVLLKWNDISNLNVTIEYLLDKLIPRHSITLLFGRGGIGKTSLMLQIVHSIANGMPFDTLQTMTTPVYYVDFENPLAVLKERVEKIGQSENLYVWHISNESQPPKLDTEEWGLYKKLPPGLLVFDTFRASHIADENDSKPMSMIMGRLKELREVGFTIILLHHTPKGNDATFKGSTAILDLCDHVLGLEEVKDPAGENIEFDVQNLYRLGTRQKTRYAPHSIYLLFKPEIKGFVVAKDPDIEKMENIREVLNRSKEPLNQKALRERINTDVGLADGEARRLIKKGTGLYWDTAKGDKNATIYSPICSACQFDSSIYTRQADKQDSLLSNSPTAKPLTGSDQGLDNTEFASLSEGVKQTDKQGVIALAEGDCKVLS